MYVGLHCTNYPEAHRQGFDGIFYVGSKVLTDLDDEYRTCQCGAPAGFTDITDANLIIAAAENELEDANHHLMSSLPGALFAQFKVDLPDTNDQIKFAHLIRKVLEQLG